MKVLAFDFGASSGRAIVYEYKNGRIIGEEIHRFDNDPVMVSGQYHWDVLRLFFEIKAGIVKCTQLGHDIEAIGIDTWGVDYGLLDKKGALLSNPYHYRDTRTDAVTLSEDDKKRIFDSTGIQFAFINTLFQLMVHKEDDDYSVAKDALFIPDLFNYMLTGVKKTEYTIASTSQMLDAKKCDFDAELLDKYGIKNLFAPIVAPGTKIGYLSDEIVAELGCKKVAVIAVASHDTASAVVSAPIEDREKSLYISCGTWLLMGAETNEPIISEKSFDYNYTNEGGVFGTYRFLHNIMGMWIQQECRRAWKKEGNDISYGDMVKQAEASPAFKCLIDPNYETFARPGHMPEKIRKFVSDSGQEVPETVGEINRCIIESLALECAKTAKQIAEMTGVEAETIHMIGGGIQNELLCQYVANASNKKVVAGPVEATGTGNALMQFVALGEIKDLAEARAVVRNSYDLKTYEPQDTDIWQEAYKKYIKICENA